MIMLSKQMLLFNQLLECFTGLDYIWRQSKYGGGCHVIYTDLNKVFDLVPHRRLLLKLQKLQVTGQMFKWLKAFVIKLADNKGQT